MKAISLGVVGVFEFLVKGDELGRIEGGFFEGFVLAEHLVDGTPLDHIMILLE